MRLLRYLLVIAAVVGAFVSAGKPSSAVEGDDPTPPVCGVGSFGPAKLYPVDDGYRETVTMSYSVTDDFTGDIRVQMWIIIPDGSGTIVAKDTEVLVPQDPGTGSATWDGTYTEADAGTVGEIVPEGLYAFTLQVTDAAGNISNECQRGVTVDHAEITRTTYKQTIGAANSELDRLVGNCSVLRKPSLRDWAGSLGYYSNKKCDDGFNKSRVATANGILVPKAFKNRYHSLRIKLYGGAARGHAGDEAALLYLKKNIDADPVLLRWMGSKVGTHAGAKAGDAASFIRREEVGEKRPYVAWQLITVNGLQYDVKNFTVVLEYTGLIDPGDAAPRGVRPRVSERMLPQR